MDKPASWMKVLNPSYSQMGGTQETFENFRTRSEHVAVEVYDNRVEASYRCDFDMSSLMPTKRNTCPPGA